MIATIILGQGGPPAGASLWQGVEHIALVASILGVVIAFTVARRKKERRRIEPDPLRVRKVSEKATEDNCKERHLTAMGSIETAAQKNDDEHHRLFDLIDVVERRGEESLKSSLAMVNETIRKMPGEMLDLLRKTGQLKNHHDD